VEEPKTLILNVRGVRVSPSGDACPFGSSIEFAGGDSNQSLREDH
jgi:hypothetical protein